MAWNDNFCMNKKFDRYSAYFLCPRIFTLAVLPLHFYPCILPMHFTQEFLPAYFKLYFFEFCPLFTLASTFNSGKMGYCNED